MTKLDLKAIRIRCENLPLHAIFPDEILLILDHLESAEKVVEATRAWLVGGTEHWSQEEYDAIRSIEKALAAHDQLMEEK